MANEEKVSIIYELVDRASSAMGKVKDSLSQFSEKANDAAAKAENLQARLDKAGKVGQVLAIGAGAIAAALGFLGKSAVDSAIKTEQQAVSFEVLLGSAAKAQKLLKEMKDFAASTPFEYTDVVEYSKRLLAMGVESENVISTMSMLGDVAAGVGTEKLPNIVLAFGQVRASGRLMTQDLNQFVNNGVPLIDALAQHFRVASGDIRKMAEQGKIGFSDVSAAFQIMTSNGGMFFNMMDKQSKTLGGQMSNLSDSVGLLSAEFGAKLAPAVGVVVGWIKSLTDWFRELSPTTKTVIAYVAAFTFGVTSLVAVLGGFLAIIPAIVSGMTTLGITMGGLASASGIGAIVVALGVAVTGIASHWDAIESLFAKGVLRVIPYVKKLSTLLASINPMVDTKSMLNGLDEYEKRLQKIANRKNATATSVSSTPSAPTRGSVPVPGAAGGGAVGGGAGNSEISAPNLFYDSKLTEKFNLSEIDKAQQLLDAKNAIRDQELIAEEERQAALSELNDEFRAEELQKNTDQLNSRSQLEQMFHQEHLNRLDDTKQSEQNLTKDQLKMSEAVLAGAQYAGEQKLSIQEAVSLGALDLVKREVIASVDAYSMKLIKEGIAKIWASFGLDPSGYASVAAGTALSAGIRSVVQPIQLAEGGIVMPRPGGTNAVIGEAGKPEAVIPLDDSRASSILGGDATRVIILDSDGMTTLAKGIYKKQTELIRDGRLAERRS